MSPFSADTRLITFSVPELLILDPILVFSCGGVCLYAMAYAWAY